MSYRRDFTLGPIGFLIIANLIVFLVVFIRPQLVPLLGLRPASFTEMPWTIVTNMFVHAGIWHIFANMMTLYFFGSLLLDMIGGGRFFLVYFGGGLLGNIFYIFLGAPFTIAVGASGAVFAVAGALTLLRPKERVFIFPIPAPLPLWVAVLGGFLILSFAPTVAWQAHLGGLLFGLAAGYFFRKRRGLFY